MSQVNVTAFPFHKLVADFPKDAVDLPISDEAITLLKDALSDGDFTFLRVMGGVSYEIIKITLSGEDLVVSRGQQGTNATTDYYAGDCVAHTIVEADETAQTTDGCSITTDTPDRLSITGNCETGYVINALDLVSECESPTKATITQDTKLLVDGCSYITVADLCQALKNCE